jgi:outer membrane receptor protein involved in Fe transport
MTIRGIGPGSGALGNQTVGQFIGDAPMGDPFGNYGTPDLDPFDLKTVEVLRGPQGTTFGASALNGAIRYVPNEPVLGEWSTRGFADYVGLDHTGSVNDDGDSGMSYGAAVNAPIGEHLAFRASGILQYVPGIYDNLQRDDDNANSAKKWSGRGALRWEPLDQLSVNLLYLKQHLRMNDVLAADNGDGRLENNNQPGPSEIEFDFSLANGDVRYQLDDWGTVVYQYTRQWKHSQGDIDVGLEATGSLGIEALRNNFDFDVSGTVHELRLVSPDGGDWDWIVGLFSRDYEGDVQTWLHTGIVEAQHGQIAPLNAKETAIFGELTRRLGSHWEATLGLRQYETRIDGAFAAALGGIRVFDTQFDQKEHGLSPKVSLSYKTDDDLMAYFTIARGFQFGGINTPLVIPLLSLIENPVTGVPVPLTFDSSVLWSRELGVRTEWLDRTLRLDVALFDIQWKKAQLSQNAGGATAYTYIDNIGKVKSRGIEGSMSWLTPIRGLSLNLLASYIRAKTANEYVNGQNRVAKGAEMPAAPPVQTSATLSYNTSIGAWATGASISHSYWSSAYSDLQHTYDLYDFETLGITLNVSRPDVPMRPALSLGWTNLTDKRGVVGRNAVETVTLTGETWTYARPRALSLRLTAEFD